MQESFSTISSRSDRRIKIVMHDDTKYLNISKIKTLMNSILKPEQSKHILDWFRLDSTNQLMEHVSRREDIEVDDCKFNCPFGANRGYYVHPELFKSFVMWANPGVANRVIAVAESTD
jgi:hypothetical protein